MIEQTTCSLRHHSGEDGPFRWLGEEVVWAFHTNFNEAPTSDERL